MARSCFKHGKTTPDSHYKTPYYNSNLVTAVITKSPSPAQGLYCVIFHCIICFVISLYLISQGLQGLEFFSGCRDFKLLSFGAEAEEDEELNVQMSEVGIRCQFKPACTMYMHPKVAIFDQPCRSTVAKKTICSDVMSMRLLSGRNHPGRTQLLICLCNKGKNTPGFSRYLPCVIYFHFDPLLLSYRP